MCVCVCVCVINSLSFGRKNNMKKENENENEECYFVLWAFFDENVRISLEVFRAKAESEKF